MQHAISRLWKSVNPEYERQNPKMKLREVCPLSLANRKALRITEFSRHLLYRHSSHNRESHNVNCRFCGAIHSVNWACISVLSQVIRNVNERKTVQTNMISFVSYGAWILKILWSFCFTNFLLRSPAECPASRNIIFRLYRFSFHKPIKSRLVRGRLYLPLTAWESTTKSATLR